MLDVRVKGGYAPLVCVPGQFRTNIVRMLDAVVVRVEMHQNVEHLRMRSKHSAARLFADFVTDAYSEFAIHLDVNIHVDAMSHAARAQVMQILDAGSRQYSLANRRDIFGR